MMIVDKNLKGFDMNKIQFINGCYFLTLQHNFENPMELSFESKLVSETSLKWLYKPILNEKRPGQKNSVQEFKNVLIALNFLFRLRQ